MKAVYHLILMVSYGATCILATFLVDLSDECLDMTKLCLSQRHIRDCHYLENFVSCISPNCTGSREVDSAANLICYSASTASDIIARVTSSRACATKMQQMNWELAPSHQVPLVSDSVWALCSAAHDIAVKLLVENSSCGADDFLSLMYVMCQPWNLTLPLLITQHCTEEVKANCLGPIDSKERDNDTDFNNCVTEHCNIHGKSFLRHRRADKIREVEHMVYDVKQELAEACPKSTLTCLDDHWLNQRAWYANTEANLSLCLGLVDEWRPCFHQTVEGTEIQCSQQTVETAISNVCYSRYLDVLGISVECDRAVSQCLQRLKINACSQTRKVKKCVLLRCTHNEFIKVSEEICASLAHIGHVLMVIADVRLPCYTVIAEHLERGVVPVKLYDSREVARYLCFLVSSFKMDNCFDTRDGPDAKLRMRKQIVSDACNSVAQTVRKECSLQAVICLQRSGSTCLSLLTQYSCLRAKCTDSEARYINADSCLSVKLMEGINRFTQTRSDDCVKKLMRCLDVMYVRGDEWYTSTNVRVMLCNLLQSENFKACMLFDRFCMMFDYEELVMIVCRGHAALHVLPMGHCQAMLPSCNYSFRKACLPEGANIDHCLGTYCSDKELEHLKFMGCRLYRMLSPVAFQLGLYHSQQCLVTYIRCLSKSDIFISLLYNFKNLCQVFKLPIMVACLEQGKCEKFILQRLVKSVCQVSSYITEVHSDCVDKAAYCFSNSTCTAVRSNRKCIMKSCDLQEGSRMIELYCLSERYLKDVSREAGSQFTSLMSCIDMSSISLSSRLNTDYLQSKMCYSLYRNNTYRCVKSVGMHNGTLEKLQVTACTNNYDPLTGMSDNCFRAVDNCMRHELPKICSQLTTNHKCIEEKCQVLQTKYIVSTICSSLDYLNEVRATGKTGACKASIWDCARLHLLTVEQWMYTWRLRDLMCFKVTSGTFLSCISEKCSPEILYDMEQAACLHYFDTVSGYFSQSSPTFLASCSLRLWILGAIAFIQLYL